MYIYKYTIIVLILCLNFAYDTIHLRLRNGEVAIEGNWFNTVSIEAQPVRDQRRCF